MRTQIVRPAGAGAPGPAVVPERRIVEIWFAAAGAVAVLVLMGGFSLVITRTDERAFADTLYPRLIDAGLLPGDLGAGPGYDLVRMLGAWFGFTTLVCLALTMIGIVLTRQRPDRRTNGLWFLAGGLVCLFGSQLLMYPIAFPFFVSAGLFALRKPDSGGPR